MPAIQILKQPYQVNFSGNPITYSFAFTPYSTPEKKLDLKMNIIIEKEVGSYTDVFTEIKSDIFFPDDNGVISLNIDTIVDAYLEFYTPRYSQTAPIKVEKQSARFRVRALTQIDGVQLGQTIVSNTIIVIKGGLAYEQNNMSAFLVRNVSLSKQPLDFNSEPIHITPLCKKYLTWLYFINVSVEQKVVYTFYFDNAPNLTHTALVPGFAKDGDIYQADVTIKSLLEGNTLNAYVNSAVATGMSQFTLYKYSVSVKSMNDFVIIRPVFYNIDFRRHFNNRSFADSQNNSYSKVLLYHNSLGGLQTLELLGEIEKQAEYSSTNAQIVPPPSGMRNSFLVRKVQSSDTLETEKFIGNTTFVSEAFLNSLRDLLLSRSVFEIKNNSFVPVVINKKNVKFYSNRDSLYSMAIEWQNAFSNTFYTPDKSIYNFTVCPALDLFSVTQISKTRLQILWAMPLPYDLIGVEVDNGATTDVITLNGNAGSQIINFTNPAVTNPVNITVRGYVICNPDVVPADKGAATVLIINAFANLAPIAVADVFSIAGGYNTPQLLPGSVLDNDYDVDGDAIEAVPVAGGVTAEGGAYSLALDGKITYTPPTSLFNGVDTFNYSIREVGNPGVTVSAGVTINVGNIGLGNGFYARIAVVNHVEQTSGNSLLVTETILIRFFADPACTIPKDATGLGVILNVNNRSYRRKNYAQILFDNTIVQTYLATGTEINIFNGLTYHRYVSFSGSITPYIVEDFRVFTLAAGAGYIPV